MRTREYAMMAFFVCTAIIGCETTDQTGDCECDKDSTDAIIVNKGFPVLGELGESKSLKNRIRTHEALNDLASQHMKRVKAALQECREVSCYVSAIRWSEKEIDTIGDHLAALQQNDAAFKELAPGLRDKGSYKLFEDADDSRLVKDAWKNAATGVNHVLDVYLKGVEPRYPAIDSISFRVNHGSYINRVHYEIDKIVRDLEADPLFFELPLKVALKALALNERDEAARYEPLEKGYNQKPVDRIDEISWDSYEYSMILIPGQGPQQRGIILDSLAMRKIDLALERYKKGLAPYMVVSGGHVHPYKTPFCEAVEMKRYMMAEFGIQDEEIFIEPHARHTTTNLRNTSRIIFRNGIPSDKPVLIVTDSGQTGYINGRMGKRAFNELGYRPFKNLKKLGDHESKFIPVEISLQADPFDILDP